MSISRWASRFWAAALLIGTTACWSVASISDEDAEPAELATGDTVKVAEVIKGDEVVVEKEGKKAKVRLLGVLAFADEIQDEVVDRWRKASIEYLQSTYVGHEVTVTLGKTAKDRHGRYLAYLARKGADVGEAMLAEGRSIVYTEYGFEREAAYLAAESRARKALQGLWSEEKPSQLVRGLRVQWSEFRAKREGRAFPDPLLAPTQQGDGAAAPGAEVAADSPAAPAAQPAP